MYDLAEINGLGVRTSMYLHVLYYLHTDEENRKRRRQRSQQITDKNSR